MTDDDRCIEWQEAVNLAREGFALFPVHISHKCMIGDSSKLFCSCGEMGCKGKHPDGKFSEIATTDIKRINNYGNKWMTRGIGVHLGKSYSWVLDIDGEEGYTELDVITDQYGKLPETRTIKTGSGGMHYCWAGWVDKIHSGSLSPNIHIKGNIGHCYHVVPPTLHYSGNRYEYINRRNPADAPEWLTALAHKGSDKSNGNARALTPEQWEAKKAYEVSIMRLLSPEQKQLLHREGNTMRGAHPVSDHGSATGRNFTIDLDTNRWFCNREGCKGTGGIFELAAILTGICKCEDFKRGSDNPLTGKKFIESVGAVTELGIPRDELRNHMYKGVDISAIC